MRARIVSGFAVLIGLAACHGSSTPTRPAPLDITARLELTGPSRIGPGETAQFQLVAVNGAGGSRDVTSTAIWTTSKAGVATVSGGAVAAHAMGDVTISARFDSLIRTQAVIVLSPGTFRVTGLVREQGLALPVGNATVRSSGSGATPEETLTTADGRFTLYGVPGTADLQVTKPGYVALSQRIELQDNTTVELTLQPAIPRPDFSGAYRLSITAADCKATSFPFPPELAQRVYTATVTQSVNRLDVAVSGADLWTTTVGARAHFAGTAEILGASFILNAADYYYARTQPDLVERLPDSTLLVISGSATTTLSGKTLGGTLQGSILQTAGNPFGTRVSQCFSSDMPFVLTRQ